MPQILKLHNVGSIYTMVVKEYSEIFVEKLRKNGASLIEPVDISLEELFVVLEENRQVDETLEKNNPSGEVVKTGNRRG